MSKKWQNVESDILIYSVKFCNVVNVGNVHNKLYLAAKVSIFFTELQSHSNKTSLLGFPGFESTVLCIT